MCIRLDCSLLSPTAAAADDDGDGGGGGGSVSTATHTINNTTANTFQYFSVALSTIASMKTLCH